MEISGTERSNVHPIVTEDTEKEDLTVFGKSKSNSLLMGGVQLVLAEKRTSLSFLRTGITVFILPITFLSVLIAFSKHYSIIGTLHFFIPVVVANFLLFGLGGYLIIRAIIRMRYCDKQLSVLKAKNPILQKFLH